MENYLKSLIFFVGERYTIADIALKAYTHVAFKGGFDLTKFSAINTWLEQVKSQLLHISIAQE